MNRSAAANLINRRSMKFIICIALIFLATIRSGIVQSAEFGAAQSALSEFRGIRYENLFTKVPTSGKLVSIKITDSGKIYYICKEKSGFVIYNLEIRPMEGIQDKIQQEWKKKSRSWTSTNPDDLLITKDIFEREVKRRFSKDSEAVWVRNEIIIEDSFKSQAQGQ